jgi:hypothetical protein
MEGELPVINGQLLPGVGDAGWPSKGGALKARSTVDWFARACRWATAQRGETAHASARRQRRSAGLGEEEGHRPEWAGWAARVGWAKFHGRNFFRI